MSDQNSGFFITKLAVTGPGKKDAELTFNDGLNVVSGASDTGKSFALSCIDFAFGAKKSPRSIPEVAGYQTVSLQLTSRLNGEHFIIERALIGGDVRIIKKDSKGNVIKDETIPYKHSADDPQTLSGVLLELTGLWGCHVRKNVKGERRSLSFRDVAYLCVVDEERIIAERPPHLSDSYIEKTAESEVFRLLVSGNESGEVVVVPGKKDIAGIDGKLELVTSMIQDAQTDLQNIGLKGAGELETELARIEEARANALSEYERARLSVTNLEDDLQAHSRTLRITQARMVVVEGLIKRFQLLDHHYDSNINRLAVIEETGLLLSALPSRPCSVCGALPDSHRPELGSDMYQPTDVQLAAITESKKVKTLKDDLCRVIEDLVSEHKQLDAKAIVAAASANDVQATINNELMPRVTQTAKFLELQNERRDLLLRGMAIIEQVAKLSRYFDELKVLRDSGKVPVAKIANAATAAEMDAFARTVETILGSWGYPNFGRVIFSESDQDLIIGESSRASHGKGVRALTCAAFIIGIMRHCREKDLPHPSVVVLDSPLVAYREPDTTSGDAQKFRQAGVKEAFYSSMASSSMSGQVIVFENEDPPASLTSIITRHHFTKINSGRYGFFPR